MGNSFCAVNNMKNLWLKMMYALFARFFVIRFSFGILFSSIKFNDLNTIVENDKASRVNRVNLFVNISNKALYFRRTVLVCKNTFPSQSNIFQTQFRFDFSVFRTRAMFHGIPQLHIAHSQRLRMQFNSHNVNARLEHLLLYALLEVQFCGKHANH